MTTIQEIEKLCKKIMETESTDCYVETEGSWVKAVVRNGVDDEPSPRARQSARRIKDSVLNVFGEDVICEVEFVDEWIDLTFKPKDK